MNHEYPPDIEGGVMTTNYLLTSVEQLQTRITKLERELADSAEVQAPYGFVNLVARP